VTRQATILKSVNADIEVWADGSATQCPQGAGQPRLEELETTLSGEGSGDIKD
jgi:hypothetical protein